MRPAIGLLALCVVTTAHAAPLTPPPTAAPPASALANATLLAPIQVESLTITPIAAAGVEHQPELDVLVLDEAMDQRKVKIREAPDEDVNNLVLVNQSDRPLFVLAGEVILGGKQDRIIGANTVIPAKTTQTVPVFCVEHGRWDNSSKTFRSAKALAHGRLRGKASFEEQGAVWREVAAKNAKRGTRNRTDTYRTVAQQQHGGQIDAWENKLAGALAKLPAPERARMIGYVVALNGQVATVDMFQSPALFRKLDRKLRRSYVTEAVDIVAAKDVKPPTTKDVEAFIDDAEQAAEEQAYENRAAQTRMKKGRKAAKSSVKLKPAPNASAPADAPDVYKTYQAK